MSAGVGIGAADGAHLAAGRVGGAVLPGVTATVLLAASLVLWRSMVVEER